MPAQSTKAYTIGNRRFHFDSRTFDDRFRQRARKGNSKLGLYAEALASEVNVTRKTVDAWRYSQNAPMDIGIVEAIARFLGIPTESLLTEVEAETMTKLTTSQHDAAARVYSEVSDFLYMLNMTDGCAWNAYTIQPGSVFGKYLTPKPGGSSDGAMVLRGEDLALAGYDYTLHALYREWPHLGNHPIYDDLLEFMDGPMDAVWNGKTDPDYRFHYSGKYEDPVQEPYPGYNEKYANRISTSEVDKAIRGIIAKYSA